MSFDNQTIIYAVLGGVLPALLWLRFWLKNEDDLHSEPFGLILSSFILGGILVFFAIVLEKSTLVLHLEETHQIVLWAGIEELIKFLGFGILLLGSSVIDEPIDYPMYMIAVALGFAAVENVLYLLKPLAEQGTIVSLFTGNLRFLGSTLLHAIASGIIGSSLGLSFFIRKYRTLYLIVGITFAILLHSVFNFLIIKGGDENFLSVFGFLWVVAIINILIFEKLKRMGQQISIA
jgi:protease PrsW